MLLSLSEHMPCASNEVQHFPFFLRQICAKVSCRTDPGLNAVHASFSGATRTMAFRFPLASGSMRDKLDSPQCSTLSAATHVKQAGLQSSFQCHLCRSVLLPQLLAVKS